MTLLQKHPSTLISHFLALPREMQKMRAMKYYENRTSNSWIIKMNDLKVIIEVEAQEIWMEQESKISSLHLFQLY